MGLSDYICTDVIFWLNPQKTLNTVVVNSGSFSNGFITVTVEGISFKEFCVLFQCN